MRYHAYRLLGGPMHGQTFAIPADHDRCQVAVVQPRPKIYGIESGSDFRYEEYVKHQFGMHEEGSMILWAHHTWNESAISAYLMTVLAEHMHARPI